MTVYRFITYERTLTGTFEVWRKDIETLSIKGPRGAKNRIKIKNRITWVYVRGHKGELYQTRLDTYKESEYECLDSEATVKKRLEDEIDRRLQGNDTADSSTVTQWGHIPVEAIKEPPAPKQEPEPQTPYED